MSTAQTNALDIDSLVAEAADRFTDDVKQGRSPSIDEYAERYPEIATIIRQVFPALTVLGDFSSCATDGLPSSASVVRGSPVDAHPASNVGVLGDFRIVREIGRGGMGIVYEAEQISLGRRVALKVLPFAAMLDKQQLARFKNEARAAATLDHPNIVAIYSVGTERGVHYYAMQLIEGQSLAQVVEQLKARSEERVPRSEYRGARTEQKDCSPPFDGEGSGEGCLRASSIQHRASSIDTEPLAHLSTLPDFNSKEYFRAVAQLGIQAAEALDHAHQNGILHRDIKPANLMVDDTGKLWITDFGLARLESDAGMTMTGDILGTLRYMSPEQALAKRVVVDHRSDIYSLGVTLYELLMLQSVFTGDDRQELLRQIAFEEPRKLRQINPRIPQDIETIILKAIEKNPAERYATARDLADDLRRFSMDQTIRAKRPNLLAVARKWVRRHRAATTVAAVVAVLLVIVAATLLADRHRQIRETRFTVESSLKAARIAMEANDLDQAAVRLTEAETRIESARLVDDDLVRDVAAMRFEADRNRKFQMLANYARNFVVGGYDQDIPVDEALALYKVMQEPNWLEELETLDLGAKYVTRIKETVYELLLLNADHLTRWASEWPKAIRQARLEAQTRDALEHLERAVAFHAPSRGYYWLSANCALIMGDKDKETRLRTTALETPPHGASELFYINRDRTWGTVSKSRGYPQYSFEDSYKDHREMLRLDPTYYNAMYFMALRLQEQGHYAEALVGWYGCFAINQNELSALHHRGIAHSRLGQFAEAKRDIDAELVGAPDHPGVLEQIAFLLATDPSQEMRDGSRAVQLAEKGCKLTQYKSPSMLDALACGYAEMGNFESAVKWSELAVELGNNWRDGAYKKHLESFRQNKPWREE